VVLLMDGDEQETARQEYDPFGRVLINTASEAVRYQFSSKEYDVTVGLNYYGYRFYSAGLGRWVNRDPIGEWVGINLYTLVNNCPLTMVDPYGLCSYCGNTGSGTGLRCCNGKPYNIARQGCCGGKIISLASQCCRDNKIGVKTPRKNCKSASGYPRCNDPYINPSLIGSTAIGVGASFIPGLGKILGPIGGIAGSLAGSGFCEEDVCCFD
jgi:RHS repeat-associated protein